MRRGTRLLGLLGQRDNATKGSLSLFSEPQFKPALLRNVAEGTGVRVGVLDPLGAGLEPGADAYFALVRGLARALAECLEAGR